IGGGTPLADAVAFGQWNAARRLVECGARPILWQASALGLMDLVEQHFGGTETPARDDITTAFWCACHRGPRNAAEFLLGAGADINWIGSDSITPLDASNRSGAKELSDWLRARGAKSAKELG